MKFFMLTILSPFLFSSLCAIPQTSSWPLTLLFSLFSLSPFLLKRWLVHGAFTWRNHHLHFPNLRGPSAWPILGTLPQIGSLAHRKLASMAASLGTTRLMAFSLGFTLLVISSHLDTSREILSGSLFSHSPIKESARDLMFKRPIGFAPAEKYLHHLRRIAANHMFSPRMISLLEELQQRVANEMLKGVWKMAEEKGVVELRWILQKGSLENILESVSGSTVTSQREELEVMVKEVYELISEFNWEGFFTVRFLDFYGVKRRWHELAGKVSGVGGRRW